MIYKNLLSKSAFKLTVGLISSLTLSLYMSFVVVSTVAAADVTLEKLFLFQQKMAKNGITSAMMKMGEMYEHGEGVKQSTRNALIMYQRAYRGGQVKAIIEIQRINNAKADAKKAQSNSKKTKQALALKKQQEQQRLLNAEKAKKQHQKIAAQKAQAAKKQAKEKAARDKIIRDKHFKAQKLANNRSARRAKAIKDAQALQAKRTKEIKFAKIRADRKAKETELAKIKAARKAELAKLQTEDQALQTEDNNDGFKTDPCKSKAARLLSTCR